MTADIREWLPGGAVTDERVSAALGDTLAHWTKHWFSDVRAAVALGRDGVKVAAALAEQMQVDGNHVSAAMAGRGKRMLLEAALGVGLANKTLTPADHRVLNALARHLVADLVSSLDALFDQAPARNRDEQLRLVLTIGGAEVCSLGCPRNALIVLLRRRLRMTGDAPLKPVDRLHALRDTPVQIHARLGGAALAIEELKELTIGDVLVLDRPVRALIELRMDGAMQPVARGRLSQADGRTTITLAEDHKMEAQQ